MNAEMEQPGSGCKTESGQGICGICAAGCAVKVWKKLDKIERVTPWDSHPAGTCCPRLHRAQEIIYSPHRLKYPMKRVGKRGSGEFRRITWDAAYTEIADQLLKIKSDRGPQAVCTLSGRGAYEQALREHLTVKDVPHTNALSLLFGFGSPNTAGTGSICYVSRAVLAPQTTMGLNQSETFADVKNSELVLLWGANPATDSPPRLYPELIKRRHHSLFFSVDHRATETIESLGGEWLGVRTGTDGALALGLIHVVIEEQLYDREFVEDWTVGFEELSQYVNAFHPKRCESITGVSAVDIRRLARLLAQKKSSYIANTGLEYSNSGVQASRAILILFALTGNLDVPGGIVIQMECANAVREDPRVSPSTDTKPVGSDKYPVFYHYRKQAHAMELPRAILQGDPYPIEALLVFGSSVLTAFPNPEVWKRSFERLKFLVTVDRHLTADSAFADIVLPAATLFETESYVTHGREIFHRPQVIEPQGEAKTDWEIVLGIADKLGLDKLYPTTAREAAEQLLEENGANPDDLAKSPTGISLGPPVKQEYRKWARGQIRDDAQQGFPTPSGLFEICSTMLKKHGYDGLPVYTEPSEGPISDPQQAEKYPLVFNSGARKVWDFRSQFHNVDGLVKRQPKPIVEIHASDAEVRGIEDGDLVLVTSPRGRVPYTARVTKAIVPGCIEANFGGGGVSGPKEWQECNVNELTDHENRDPISGFPVYKALLCEVAKLTPSSTVCNMP